MTSFAEYLGVNGTTCTLKIGESFTWKDTPYHSLRCDFKPASVDMDKEATLEVGDNNNVSLSVPLEGDSTTNFQGSQKCHMKECVLIFDHATGEITIERLGSQIQLKKTRTNGVSKFHRGPFPFDKKKLSPMSGCGTPTRSTTPPDLAVKKNGTVGNMPGLESHDEDSDDGLGLAQMRPKNNEPQVLARTPSLKSESSASSESESSSSSSSSDNSSDEEDNAPPARKSQLHNMPVIEDDLELPSAPAAMPNLTAGRSILSEDLRLSDSDSDSD